MNSALRKAFAGFSGFDVFALASFPGTEGITFLLAISTPPQAIKWSVVSSIDQLTPIQLCDGNLPNMIVRLLSISPTNFAWHSMSDDAHIDRPIDFLYCC